MCYNPLSVLFAGRSSIVNLSRRGTFLAGECLTFTTGLSYDLCIKFDE